MKFTPRSESEVSKIFEKGNYKFEVIDANEKTSKNGNEMIHLKLSLYHNSIPGKSTMVDTYLLSDNPNFEYLIRHFCVAVGLEDKYNLGTLEAPDCLGCKGIAKVTVEEDKTGNYPPKNRVVDFIEESSASHGLHINNNTNSDGLNDDLPF